MSINKTKTVLSQETLSDDDIVYLLGLTDPEDCELLQQAAFDVTTKYMGNYVYYRGLIEVSNICTAGCRYCGIRRENHCVERYTMQTEEIVKEALDAAKMGYGSICLQAGERRDAKFVDWIEAVLKEIHEKSVSEDLPEGLGITLSLGEQTLETYQRWAKAAGTTSLRYLARFETSNPELFKILHCAHGNHEKVLEHRFKIMENLREAGYQVGTGVMIGIPTQTLEDLCRDIRTYQKLNIDMVGMGPYLLSEGSDLTEYGMMEKDKLIQLSLNMIAVTRIVLKDVNIAAATALQAIRADGREQGVRYGANVMMPNLTPTKYREGYQLYKNKPGLKDTPASAARVFEASIVKVGREVGWNLTGSSIRWQNRTGIVETGEAHRILPDEDVYDEWKEEAGH